MSRRNKRSNQRPAVRDLDSIHALRLPQNTKSRPTLAFPSESFVAAPVSETRVADSVPPIEESAVKELPPVSSRSGDEGSLRPVEAALDADFGDFFERESLPPSDEWDEAPVPAPHHSSFAIERRKKARTYVVGVVAVCAAVAALAFVARMVPGSGKSAGALAVAAPIAENQLAANQAQPVMKEAPLVARVTTPAVNPAKALAEEIPEPDSVAAPVEKKVEADPKAAKAKRESARGLLERGKTLEAIEDATLSTELDPTDADAWLILGAAYQEKGQGAKAMAAFKACLKEGKRGAKNECAAMLGAH